MNSERYDEMSVEQVKINSILAKWSKSLPEDDYYSLKDTLISMLAYIMENSDEKPAINPLVETYAHLV